MQNKLIEKWQITGLLQQATNKQKLQMAKLFEEIFQEVFKEPMELTRFHYDARDTIYPIARKVVLLKLSPTGKWLYNDYFEWHNENHKKFVGDDLKLINAYMSNIKERYFAR